MSSEHGSRLFGDPKIINAATESAIFEARSLQQEIDKYRTILGELQPPISEAYVQSTLFQVENSVKSISRELSLIKRAEAAVDVAKARSLAFALEDTLTQLRERFPSDGPIRIDNGALFVQFRVSRLSEELEHAFANPARGAVHQHLSPTLWPLFNEFFWGQVTELLGSPCECYPFLVTH